MLRAVLDTSVIVSALRSASGASNACLRLVAEERIRPLVTTALFLEYEAVLLGPEQRLAHGLTPEKVESFLAALASANEAVEVSFQWRPQLADPNDEMVLEAAVNGRADRLVTFNLRHFERAARRFGIAVRRPGDLLEEMRS
ncbi:MAG: putative toxin-antitoxin system toxin component, PIN family [Sphingomonadaceae bacterium]|nr:putative toxin-antitoxin system toxin component, PIN family [Sphingomonadaceae bacterium]